MSDDTIVRLNAAFEGRYEIERPLGQGGMATVYRAADLRHGRAVAIKVLHPEIVHAVGSERFLREIQVTARLRHPHILPLLDSGDADGLLYYVMPCLDGEDESLSDRLRREGQLPLEDAVRITLQVADALDYAHGHGVVHRDIKPGNILLEAEHAVVSDFGIALLLDLPSDRLTGSRGTPGSPTYVSPEQAMGEAGADHRSDIYSLACVLYEMLAGDPPFSGRVARAILTRKLTENPPGLRSARPSVPPEVEGVVLKALAPSPADRHADAAEFAAALRGAFEAADPGRIEGVPARPAAGLPPPTRPVGPARGVWIAGSVLALLALIATVGLLSNLAFDLALGVPAEHTPTESRTFVVGLRALVPELFWFVAAYLGWMALRSLSSLVRVGARRIPSVDRRLESLASSTRAGLSRAWTRTDPRALADGFFLAALASTILVLWAFGDLISAAWGQGDPRMLACDRKPLHFGYTLTLTSLIFVIAFGGHRLFREVARRGARGPRVTLLRGASLALVLLLLVTVTFPWRLLFNKGHPRFTMDGHPAYLIGETDGALLLYRPDLRTTVEAREGGPVELRRLGSNGYLFETRESFDGRDPVC